MQKSAYCCHCTGKRFISLTTFLLLALLISNLSSYGKEPGPILIRIEPTSDTNGIFKANEPLRINVHLENTAKRKIKTVLTCSLTTDEDDPIYSMQQKHDLKLSGKLTRMIKFNVKAISSPGLGRGVSVLTSIATAR